VEVKVGVHNATRELVIDSTLSTEEIQQAVRDAVENENGILDLADAKGRRLLVRGVHLAYVDVGEPLERRVGFGT